MAFDPPFSFEEYAQRVETVQEHMRRRDLDVIVCQDPANLFWLTGFDSWSFYTPQAVILGVDDVLPTWFGRPQDAPAAQLTTVLPDKNIRTFSELSIHRPDIHPFDELAELLRDRGYEKARIGVEMDSAYYTARAHRHLVDGLPKATVSDSHELVNWSRAVKSEAELALMRQAGRICNRAMTAAAETLAPGVPQSEVVAAIVREQVVGCDGVSGDYPSIWPLIQVGEGTKTPHLTWSEEPLPDHSAVVVEIAGVRRHYHAPLSRTFHIGPPPEALRKLAGVIVEGVDAALATARPGATCAEVEAVWQKVLNKNGFEKRSRVGYSIGLGFPPDWGERTMSLSPGDFSELQTGMCFHFQSGVWLEHIGAAVSESFVVTETGGERLCDVERELIVLG